MEREVMEPGVMERGVMERGEMKRGETKHRVMGGGASVGENADLITTYSG
jgi:hypothetical protein